MKKSHKIPVLRAIASLLTLCTLLATVIIPAPAATVTIPTDASLFAQVSTIYQRAIDYDYAHYNYAKGSYTSKCGHYVNVQLIINGVNTRYVSGNGNDQFDNYKDKAYSSGGKKIHAYPATKYTISEALKDIVKQSNVATNILLGFQYTMTTAGQKYGHTMLIHGIIGNYVYFTDNLAGKYGGVSYKMGDPVKCTIAEFEAFYGRPTVFGFEGLIWFEDTALTAAVNNNGETTDPGTTDPEPETDPDTPSSGGSTVTYETGEYSVTYKGGLWIRAGASTSYSKLELLPYNASVYVTEIKNNFGHVYCTVEGAEYDGWICLDYAKRNGPLPPLALEELDSSGKRTSQQWFDTLPEALSETSGNCRIILYSDVAVAEDCTVSQGVTVNAGNYDIKAGKGSLLIRGGTVTGSKAVSAAAEDPFVDCKQSETTYTYTCNASITLKSASLVIGNNVSLKFKAETVLPQTASNISFKLICENFAGGSAEFDASETASGSAVFITGGIPAKYLGDHVTVRATMTATVNGRTYSFTSSAISYSAVEYVGSLYGTSSSNDKLNSMMAAMLNYSAAAQTYFKYNTDQLANRALPNAAKNPSTGNGTIINCDKAPVVSANSSTHVTGVQLVIGDTVSIRLNAKDAAAGTKLLVWTAAEYKALEEKAKSAGKELDEYLTAENCTTVLAIGNDGTFSLENIPAKKFADTFCFRLCETTDNGNAYDAAFSYSVTEYCAYMLNNGKTDSIDALCRALCDYSAAAREYFGYTINSGN